MFRAKSFVGKLAVTTTSRRRAFAGNVQFKQYFDDKKDEENIVGIMYSACRSITETYITTYSTGGPSYKLSRNEMYAKIHRLYRYIVTFESGT